MTLWRQWIWNASLWLTRNRQIGPVLEFRQAVRGTKRWLIYLAEETAADQWKNVHERLVTLFENSEITLLARDGLSDETVESAKVMKGIREIRLLGQRDFGWRANVRRRVIEELRKYGFDIVLDYSRTFDLAMAYALCAVGAPVMAGMHLEPEAERFYNLIVRPDPTTGSDDALLDCLSKLR
ncbi:MAG: hypothetical protein KDC45_06205 [Bacteroidetes bacterium]|nr:hypothetical protein [Bacteroidota bacterium]